MNHEWHHVPQKSDMTVGQRIAAFLGIEKPPLITYQAIPAAGAIAYTFPDSYRLISSTNVSSLFVDYSDRRKVSEQIENVKQAEHPHTMSPVIRAAELFQIVDDVSGIIVEPARIIVGGGNPEDHEEALNGVAHEHSIFFGSAKITPAEEMR